MEKYHWTESTFWSIDWKAHNKELQQIHQGKRTTLIKYIHGWLATKKYRNR